MKNTKNRKNKRVIWETINNHIIPLLETIIKEMIIITTKLEIMVIITIIIIKINLGRRSKKMRDNTLDNRITRIIITRDQNLEKIIIIIKTSIETRGNNLENGSTIKTSLTMPKIADQIQDLLLSKGSGTITEG